jgi:hypothetical protein
MVGPCSVDGGDSSFGIARFNAESFGGSIFDVPAELSLYWLLRPGVYLPSQRVFTCKSSKALNTAEVQLLR